MCVSQHSQRALVLAVSARSVFIPLPTSSVHTELSARPRSSTTDAAYASILCQFRFRQCARLPVLLPASARPLLHRIRCDIYLTVQSLCLFSDIIEQTFRIAVGIYPTKHLWWTPAWEEVCYPSTDPELRRRPMLWAQFLIAGHTSLAVFCILQGWWLVPVMISLGETP